MSNKKTLYEFVDPSGNPFVFKATSLQQAMVMKKKQAEALGIPKEQFQLSNIGKR